MKTFLALFLLWAFVSSRLAFAEKVGVASTAAASASVSTTASSGSSRDGGPAKGSTAASISQAKSKAGSHVESLLKDGSNDDLSEEYSGEDCDESGESWEVTSAEADSKFEEPKDPAWERFWRTHSSSNSRASSASRTHSSGVSKPLPSSFSRSAGSNASPGSVRYSPADAVAYERAVVLKLENEEKRRKLAALKAAELADRAAKAALEKQRVAEERAVVAQNLSQNATMAQKVAQATTAVLRSAMDNVTDTLSGSDILLQQYRKDLKYYVEYLAHQAAAAQNALKRAEESRRYSMSAVNISIQAARNVASSMTQLGNHTAVQREAAKRIDRVAASVLAAVNRAEAAVETEMRALIEQAQKGAIYLFPFLGTKQKP